MSLTIVEENTLHHFVSTLSAHFADNYLSSYLFGSKARGDYEADSDLDVAVILKRADYRTKCDVIDLAYEELLNSNVEISPLVFSQNDYERQRREGFPIIREIERDMVKL
jgi:uncharacterized protein